MTGKHITGERYTFATEWDEERARLAHLGAFWEPASRRALAAAGVPEGASCLDVGAGGGSVSRLLADMVGEGAGRVVALDVDTRHLEAAALPSRVEVRRHDLLADEPLGETFDVVHARMVLSHLPERARVLDRLVEYCAPGGLVVLSEFDIDVPGPLPAPRTAAERFQRVHDAVVTVLGGRGCDNRFGHRLPAALAERGLTGVDALVDGGALRGGSAGAEFYRHTFRRLREPLLAGGLVGEEELGQVLADLADPGFVTLSAPLVSAWGRRGPAPARSGRSAG
ncbi:bifunctional 2-polyprenyl-6-hydroxyphenol methylase/3-demethylubiquinol 3-O-methyltransferase UbiG [Streptomyces sp. JJ38]|uniref:class I SAM-dependent methyltransferase n=1 Tax=Streptomyces sp. JJ38 TaxID=2738128 RepID=UPI001C58A04C|nr:class I SAM-dependent methyltransferase [Streptomyces sp. JJ38]MBW1599085.1 class I SAM-dependent methyltransferase [Streptomyces sp. JJ38]